MAKQCIYCGGLLAKENARFCHECGQSQIPPDGHAPGPIKVKVPPKELTYNDPPGRPAVIVPEPLASATSPVPSLPERPVAPRRPSHLPKRPVLLTAPEEPGATAVPAARDEPAEVNPAATIRLADARQAVTPTPAEDISTTTLPNWREELARLRKKLVQTAPDTPVTPEPPARISVTLSPLKKLPETPSPLPEQEESQAEQSQEQEEILPDSETAHNTFQDNLPSETLPFPEHTRTSENLRRELRVRVWEQEEREGSPQEKTEKLHPEEKVKRDAEPEPQEMAQENALPQTAVGAAGPDAFPDAGGLSEETAEVHHPGEAEQEPAEADHIIIEEKAGAGEQEELEQQDNAEEKRAIEDLPTLRLPATEPPKAGPRITIERASTPAPKRWSVPPVDEVASQPTRPMVIDSVGSRVPIQRGGEQRPGAGAAAFHSGRPARVVTQAQPSSTLSRHAPQVAVARQQPASASAAPAQPAPTPISPTTSPHTTKAEIAGAGTKTKTRPKQRRGRMVGIIFLLLVLLGGGSAAALNWSWITQFFVVPATNQPYQTFQNSSLGVSLDYTRGWNVKVDQAHGIVSFADSTHTNQVSLTVEQVPDSLAEYLKQRVIQSGITGAQPESPITFARSTWQVLQGAVTQSGATYTAVLYVTQHNDRFYTLAFLAPPVVFTHADQANFAHMRASLSFV